MEFLFTESEERFTRNVNIIDTERQARIRFLRRQGKTFREIGGAVGTCSQNARNIFYSVPFGIKERRAVDPVLLANATPETLVRESDIPPRCKHPILNSRTRSTAKRGAAIRTWRDAVQFGDLMELQNFGPRQMETARPWIERVSALMAEES